MRLTSEQLQEVMKKYGVDRIWSWSKINCFHNSPYEYYLKYIAHEKEDRANSIYTTTGGMAHEILEKLYTDEIKYEDMIGEFEDAWTVAYDIAQLKFNRSDEESNTKIADKYYECLVHFFNNHTKIKYKTMIEEFISIVIGDNLLQGYIDCSFVDDNGVTHIIDFKTSSMYKGEKALNECGQLVLYAIGLNQRGIPYDKIKIAWNFLKYCTIQYEQANGVVKTRDVERAKIGESLQANLKVWIKKLGYADQMDKFLKMVLDTNGIECLPHEIQDKYKISDCYVYVDLTQELIDRWTTHIVDTIKDIELREKDYEETHSERVFWESMEQVEKQSYYFANLCSYSANLHKPYSEYLTMIEKKKNGEDLYNGLGSDVTESVASVNNNDDEEIDLSWLNNL